MNEVANQEVQLEQAPSESERREAIEDFITQLYTSYDDIPADRYPWLYERERWYELVFCLLNRIGPEWIPPQTARDIIEQLVAEGLLDVAILASAESQDGEPIYTTPELAPIKEALLGVGFSTEEAEATVQTIYEMAQELQEQHDGRIQKYLRQYGQLMIKELSKTFSFSRVSDTDVRYIFTHWLQNVLNMPIALSDPGIEAVCRDYDVSVDELVNAADRLGVNVALLDDLVANFVEQESS